MKPAIAPIITATILVATSIANAGGIVSTGFDFSGSPYSEKYDIVSDELVFTIGNQKVIGQINWFVDGEFDGSVEMTGPGIELVDVDPFGRDVRYATGAYGIMQTFGWGPGSSHEGILPGGTPLIVDGVEYYGTADLELVVQYGRLIHDFPQLSGFDELRLRGSGRFISADKQQVTYSIDTPLDISAAVPEPAGGDLAITTAIAVFLVAGQFGVRRR